MGMQMARTLFGREIAHVVLFRTTHEVFKAEADFANRFPGYPFSLCAATFSPERLLVRSSGEKGVPYGGPGQKS